MLLASSLKEVLQLIGETQMKWMWVEVEEKGGDGEGRGWGREGKEDEEKKQEGRCEMEVDGVIGKC